MCRSIVTNSRRSDQGEKCTAFCPPQASLALPLLAACSQFMSSLPLSQTRPKRASAAATADAIGRSLKEQDAAPDQPEPATKKSRADDEDVDDVQTPAKRQSKPKAAKPSSKAALKAAPPADVAAIKPAEYAAQTSNTHPNHTQPCCNPGTETALLYNPMRRLLYTQPTAAHPAAAAQCQEEAERARQDPRTHGQQ